MQRNDQRPNFQSSLSKSLDKLVPLAMDRFRLQQDQKQFDTRMSIAQKHLDIEEAKAKRDVENENLKTRLLMAAQAASNSFEGGQTAYSDLASDYERIVGGKMPSKDITNIRGDTVTGKEYFTPPTAKEQLESKIKLKTSTMPWSTTKKGVEFKESQANYRKMLDKIIKSKDDTEKALKRISAIDKTIFQIKNTGGVDPQTFAILNAINPQAMQMLDKGNVDDAVSSLTSEKDYLKGKYLKATAGTTLILKDGKLVPK